MRHWLFPESPSCWAQVSSSLRGLWRRSLWLSGRRDHPVGQGWGLPSHMLLSPPVHSLRVGEEPSVRTHPISSGHLPATRLACQGQAEEPGSGPALSDPAALPGPAPCSTAAAGIPCPCAWESGPSHPKRWHLGLPTAEGRRWLTKGTRESCMDKKQRMCENVEGTGSQARP